MCGGPFPATATTSRHNRLGGAIFWARNEKESFSFLESEARSTALSRVSVVSESDQLVPVNVKFWTHLYSLIEKRYYEFREVAEAIYYFLNQNFDHPVVDRSKRNLQE